MVRIDFTESITAHETRAQQVRQGARIVDSAVIKKELEHLADDDRPLVIAVYGVREDGKPGDFFMRECRALLIYEGRDFKALEKEREETERREGKDRQRQARLDQIKARLRAGRKTEDLDFDRKYAGQVRSLEEAEEAEIEAEAAAILLEEEAK